MKFASGTVLLLIALACAPAASRADIAHGDSLFHTYCVPCHGFPPSGGAQFGANDPARITAAINGIVPPMGFLRPVLTAGDINDIAAYLGTLSAPLPPTTIVPAFDFTDLWWNDAESGWGLNLMQHASGNIFGVMYTYEAPNRPLWLVIPGGTWTSTLTFTGAMYRVTGPLASAFDPSKVNVQPVGTATIAWSDRDHGVFSFTLNGTTVTKTITRQPF
ncbi:MAG: c-type cytochrome [Betaproteobacteria bacterium]